MESLNARATTDSQFNYGAPSAPSSKRKTGLAAVPILDQRILADLQQMDAEGGTSFLTKLIDAYLCHAASALPELGDAVDRRDMETVRVAAHGFKSSSSSIGAVHLAGLCLRLEKMGRVGMLEGVDAVFMHVQSEFRRVRVALIEQRDGNSPVV